MINTYFNLLPKILEIINANANEDEKKTCDMFEIIEELIEYAVSVVVPHVKLIVQMCLQIANYEFVPNTVQIKAVSVIGWLIRSKGKVSRMYLKIVKYYKAIQN